eukprot:TRINITY_DN4464_c0_g1_i2.p2 TRINITY_DN4464_c0_g1~~TRINITY_DN4464_c0_g1_i2.p2  ORF type:complete len:218 (+),score=50.98 TRINITY_DN4464_c0_g1_i2:345-998(+)
MSTVDSFSCNVRFVIFMHYKEFYRASNTAKIMQIAAPNATELLIYGKKDDDVRLVEIAQKDPQHTMILFPSTDALSIPDYLARFRKSDGRNEVLQSGERPTVTVIVLDGTWGNTATIMRHCNKTIPTELNIPKVKLNPDFLSAFSRAQSQADRICTLEAMVLLLKEFGEPEDVQNLLLANMKINVDTTAVPHGKLLKKKPNFVKKMESLKISENIKS